MTELQMNIIKKHWNDKQIHDLIFDETPYKVYSAKMTGNSILKHLSFNEQDGTRAYYGEGSLVFTCYFPYARSRYEYYEDYKVDNIHEWVADEDFSALEKDAKITESSFLESATLYYDFIDSEDNTVNASIASYERNFDYVYDPGLLEESDFSPDATSTANMSYGLQDSGLNNKQEWIESSLIPSNLVYGKYSAGEYKIYNAGDVPIPFRVWFKT
jgi:hypothetical protein